MASLRPAAVETCQKSLDCWRAYERLPLPVACAMTERPGDILDMLQGDLGDGGGETVAKQMRCDALTELLCALGSSPSGNATS